MSGHESESPPPMQGVPHEAGGRDLALFLYDELHDLAARFLRRERADHTLQTTALLHEAWLRLQGQRQVDRYDRSHFFGLAAMTMRRVLVDYERGRRRLKRGGDERPLRLTMDVELVAGRDPIDLLILDEALEELADVAPRQCRIVEMRFFAGLSPPEVADVLGLSPRTVAREWALAKTWLRSRLEQAS